MVLKKANVNREEISTVVKDKINEFAMRGFRALGVSVADGDQTGPDECAPSATLPSVLVCKRMVRPACGAAHQEIVDRPTATRPAPTSVRPWQLSHQR